MKHFETLESYETVAELGDHVALSDLILTPEYKMQTFRVVDIFRGRLTVRLYRSKVRLILEKEQQIILLTSEEYKNLKR